MVKKIFSFLHKEISGLHQAAYLLGFFSFLSQILGLVRDRLLAHIFGAGTVLDTYYAAFRIPDFIFVTVASMVSLSVLVPILIEKTSIDISLGRKFVSSVFSVFFSAILGISVIAWILMPFISSKVFPGISGEQLNQLILYSRILLLSPILLGLSNIFGSITQAYNRFMIYALSPILYNAGIVLGAIFLTPFFGIMGVVYGVLIGASMHLLIQLPFITKIGLLPRFSFSGSREVLKKVFGLSVPRTLALASNHISNLFLISLASLLTAGSISIFNLSFNLQSVPLSIIGVSYSLAAFPTLARLFAQKDFSGFAKHISDSARHIIFWSIPITVLFIVLRAQIVRTVLGSGAFDWASTRLTAATLALFVLSACFQSLVVLFVRGYYAAGKTFKPLVVNLLSAFITVSSAYYFVSLFKSNAFFQGLIESLFRVSDISGTSVLMLALGFSVGSFFNGLVLVSMFLYDYKVEVKPLFKVLFQVFGASMIAGFVAYLLLNVFDSIFDLNTLIGIFSQGLISGCGGILAGIGVLFLLQSEELKDMGGAIHRKIFRTKVIGPDPEMV